MNWLDVEFFFEDVKDWIVGTATSAWDAIVRFAQAIWDRVVVALQGKHIAVLGPQAVGKTSLYQYLQDGTLPKRHVSTVHKEAVPGMRRKIKQLDLKVAKGADVGGGVETPREDWQPLLLKCDILIYMVRLKWVIACGDRGEHSPEIIRAISDLDWINDELVKQQRAPLFVLLFSGVDEDPEYVRAGNDLAQLQKYETRQILRKRASADLIYAGGGLGSVVHAFGSFATTEWAERTILRIFSQVADTTKKA